MNKKLSKKGIESLIILEGKKMKGGIHMPYYDRTKKIITKYQHQATIGYGHLIRNKTEFKKYKDGITEEEAISLKNSDSTKICNHCNDLIKVELSQEKFDACVILVFNIGREGFRTSSILKFINNPNAKTNYSTPERAWKAFNKDKIDGVKVVVKGLVNRRAKEWPLFEDGIYPT